MAQGVPGRLRPRIFFTFGTTRVVGRQPYASAAFTPGEIRGTHCQRLSRLQGTWFCRWEPRKKSPVIPPGIDPGTVRLVAQCLNHYDTHFKKWYKQWKLRQVFSIQRFIRFPSVEQSHILHTKGRRICVVVPCVVDQRRLIQICCGRIYKQIILKDETDPQYVVGMIGKVI